jgi:hypothetical protein
MSAHEIAGLVKKERSRQLPRELRALSSYLPGRRKKYNNIRRDYETVSCSPLFDPDWYLNVNKDVSAGKLDPVLHYILHGAREGRAPGPLFDGAKYLEANPDLRQASVNPLIHYLTVGRVESRPLEKRD